METNNVHAIHLNSTWLNCFVVNKMALYPSGRAFRKVSVGLSAHSMCLHKWQIAFQLWAWSLMMQCLQSIQCLTLVQEDEMNRNTLKLDTSLLGRWVSHLFTLYAVTNPSCIIKLYILQIGQINILQPP